MTVQPPERPIPRDLPLSPDCADRFKHQACSGDAWDDERDEPTACTCPCHEDDRRLTAWDILGIQQGGKSTQQIIDEQRDRP